jgi:hypothetical protein
MGKVKNLGVVTATPIIDSIKVHKVQSGEPAVHRLDKGGICVGSVE